MCSFSMISDHYHDRWHENLPTQWMYPPSQTLPITDGPSQAEFDALKAEVENLKALLIRAKEYDAATGQPDCEKDEKVELVRKVAQLVGVDLSDVLGPPS